MKITQIEGQDLEGKVVLLSPEHYKGDDHARLFRCEGGFGCKPYLRGNGVMGYFLADGEKGRVERWQIVGLVDDMNKVPENFPTKMFAAMLLMREVVCEKIYRETVRLGRANFDFEHPNKAMGIRDITPEKLAPWVTEAIIDMSNDERKLHASQVLDAIMRT